MQVITEEILESDVFRDYWRKLHAQSELQDLGNSYEWVTNWWRFYKSSGAGTKELLVLADDSNAQPNVIFPLMVRRILGFRSIEFIGQSGGHITDYIGAVGDSKWAGLLDHLYQDLNSWDVLSLAVPGWSSAASDIAKSATMAGLRQGDRWRIDVADLLVRLYIPADFGEYLGRLGKSTRKRIREYMHKSETVGGRLDILTGPAIQEELPTLYALNSLNWPIFAHQRDRDFMSSTLSAFEQSEGPFLAALSFAGEVHATVLGFRAGDVCYLHPAGVRRRDVEGISPGTLMHVLLIQQMISAGVKVLDFSPGIEEHKLRLGGRVEPLLKITMWHQKSRWLNRWLVDNVRRLNRALRVRRRPSELRIAPHETSLLSKTILNPR